MTRVIAVNENDPEVLLVETGTVDEDGLRLGRVYEAATDTLHPALPVVSIAARGYWAEVDPSVYADLAANLAGRV